MAWFAYLFRETQAIDQKILDVVETVLVLRVVVRKGCHVGFVG